AMATPRAVAIASYTRAASSTCTRAEMGKPLAMTAPPEVRTEALRGWTPANFDEWEAWIDRDAPHDPSYFSIPHADPQLELTVDVDLVAGEFFRSTWRRRLISAEGDCGYVARQMRKAGVPLDLALAILLIPEPVPTAVRTSVMRQVSTSREGDAAERFKLRYFATHCGPTPAASDYAVRAAAPITYTCKNSLAV
ncbi:MAG: hypothetical protein ABL900_13940, partial [Burkholderiaceae bacterium]